MNKIMERWQVLLSEDSNLSQENKDILDMLKVLDILDEPQENDEDLDDINNNSFSLESSTNRDIDDINNDSEKVEFSQDYNNEKHTSDNFSEEGDNKKSSNDTSEDGEDIQAGEEFENKSDSNKIHSSYGTNIKENLWLKKIMDIFPENVTLKIIDELVKRDLPIALPEEIINKVEVNQNTILSILNYAKNHKNNELVKKILIKKIENFVDQMMHTFKKEVSNSISEKNSEYVISRLRSKKIAVKKTIIDNLINYDLENNTLWIDKIWYKNYLDYFNDHHMMIAIDQSGSMDETNFYATIIAGTFALLNNIETTLIKFDSEVYDFSDMLDDVVSIIFDTYLGGGTDINKAVNYINKLVKEPRKTIFILITDLEDNIEYLPLLKDMIESKVTVIVIPGITDSHSLSYNRKNAKDLSEIGCHFVEGNSDEVMRCIMNII